MEGKVLFIDDQEDFLKLIQIKLKDEPYKKFYASNIESVFKILSENDIDVVVSDLNMPYSGIELFKNLRDKYPNVVRVALSGLLHTSGLLAAINDGDVYKYITKPWKIDEDGKKVILESLEYANYLKYRFNYDCSSDGISLETFQQVLLKIGISHSIVDKSKAKKNDISLNFKYALSFEK